MDKNNENKAHELYTKALKGELSIEQAASILSQFPAVAKILSDMMKEDAKQHKELSEAELKSVDKLTDLMNTIWSDQNATPEQKQAQCDKILEQQANILKSKEVRQERHEDRKDYTYWIIGGVLVAAALLVFGGDSNKSKVITH